MMTLKQEKRIKIDFIVAYHDFEKGLNTHSLFKMHDKVLSEDLVQDTFIKTWSYLARGGKIVLMKAFLYHILNDLIIDEYRKHNKTTSLDVLLEKGFQPKAGDSSRFLNILDGKAAFLLIERLPLLYQKVMSMRYVKNLSIKEISFITGQSRNTVTVQAHRGLEKLKILYNHQ